MCRKAYLAIFFLLNTLGLAFYFPTANGAKNNFLLKLLTLRKCDYFLRIEFSKVPLQLAFDLKKIFFQLK